MTGFDIELLRLRLARAASAANGGHVSVSRDDVEVLITWLENEPERLLGAERRGHLRAAETVRALTPAQTRSIGGHRPYCADSLARAARDIERLRPSG